MTKTMIKKSGTSLIMRYPIIWVIFLVWPLSACQGHHGGHAAHHADTVRLDAVQDRGTHVMPFDLEKTLHVFTKTEEGGLQEVVAKNPQDREQIDLIRQHLRQIREDFSRRNFSGPAFIHGEDMPGLATLKQAGPDELHLEYKDLPAGARVSYSSPSPKIREAIHQWFDAQLSDHARHAVPGHQN